MKDLKYKKDIMVQLTLISIAITLTFLVWIIMLYFFKFSLLDVILLYFKIIDEPLNNIIEWTIHIGGFLLGLIFSYKGIKSLKKSEKKLAI